MNRTPSKPYVLCYPGRMVLFLHAFPLHSGMWEPLYPLLETRHIPYISVNYPGFGNTPCFLYRPEIEDYARFVLDIIDEVGLKDCVLVGSSMGGYVALACMRLFPERIAGVALLHTKCEPDTPEIREKRFQFIQTIEEKKSIDPIIEPHLQGFLTEPFRKRNPGIVAHLRRMMEASSRKGVVHALHAMAYRPSSEQTLEHWKKPLFILTGSQDPFAPPETAHKMAALASESTCVIVQDTAHLSHYEVFQPYEGEFIEFLSGFYP